MKLYVLLAWLLPVLWGVAQGLYLKNHRNERKRLFHAISLGGYFFLVGWIPFLMNWPWDIRWQLFLVSAGSKFLLFDHIINMILRKGWFFFGQTSIWDRFWNGTLFNPWKYPRLDKINHIVAQVYLPLNYICVFATALLTRKLWIQ